jgi:hypothetical protein
MKKVLAVAAILIVIIVIVILLVFQMTSGVVEVADQFFAEVKAGNVANAYEHYLSEDFRAATTLEELESFLEKTALSNYSGASWSSRSISGDQGKLEGSIETADGGTIPITIDLVKENDEWKILSIYKPESGLVSDERTREIPSDAELKELASASVHNLALAINNDDFKSFYNDISEFWRSQTTPAELKGAFKSFVEQQVDLTVLQGMEPVFSEPPALDENSSLVLKGYFASQPSMTYFDLSYIYEHPEWKLVGIAVDLK